MAILRLKSIQVKITLWAGLCLLIASTLFTGHAATTLRSAAIAAAEEQALAVAQAEAGKIKAEIEVALDAARALAQALSAIQDPDNPILPSRQEINIMLKRVLVDTPQFVSVYTLWEPDAFDGKDINYISVTRYDQTGRFIPYWSRSKTGQIEVEPALDYEIPGPGDYYQIPKKTKQEAIINPRVHLIQGEEALIISLVAPIMVGEQFYGIVGVDLRLEFLQEQADAVDLYDGSAMLLLISNDGALAGVTGRPEWVGEDLGIFHENREADITFVQQGREMVKTKGDTLEVFVPIQIGHTTTPWSVNLNLPMSKITAEATTVMWEMIGISALLIGVALVVLWFLAGRIAKPIKEITAVAQAVAGGNLEIEASVESADETGVLAGDFNLMIARLRDMLHSEEERAAELAREIAERVLAEQERERLQQEIIQAQNQAIQELSTPIIPVMDRIIILPLIGSIDSARAQDITRSLLAGIREHHARVVILDITGVPIVDSGVAGYLDKTIQAARLKGARTIVTGISDAVAEAIVDLGIDWSGLDTLSDLQTGLVVALRSLGLKVTG